MSNIVITYWTEIADTFYEAIGKELIKLGHNVLLIDFNGYVSFEYWGSTFVLSDRGKKIESKILKFNPDVVIAFNNMLPPEFTINIKCKICLVDADSFDMGFWNKDFIKQNKKRFIFLGSTSYSKQAYKTHLGSINYYYFPLATAGYSQNLPKTKNISFIGGNFLYVRNLVDKLDFANSPQMFRDIIAISKSFDFLSDNNFINFSKKFNYIKDPVYLNKLFSYFNIYTVTGIERVKFLSVFSDLGLNLYGTRQWYELLYYDMDLAKCFKEEQIITFKQNMDIYNSSKISINISHQQAVSGFSWRVMDIMASSSCLLMEKKKDWDELFGNIISDEVKNAIIYTDRYDARQKALRLLEDEELRLRCVRECNKAIEINGRWDVRFRDLLEFLNIYENDQGRLGFLQKITYSNEVISLKEKYDTYNSVQEITKDNTMVRKKYYQNMQFRNRFKNIINLTLLLLAQIPPIDLLFFKRKKRRELLEKINRYWR